MVNGLEESHLAFYAMLGSSTAFSALALTGVGRYLRCSAIDTLLQAAAYGSLPPPPPFDFDSGLREARIVASRASLEVIRRRWAVHPTMRHAYIGEE